MSPVGRTFIVLNLFLAGAFVYFSGVYLQKATDWKAKHDTVQAEKETQVESLTQQVQAVESDKRDLDRKLTASEAAKNSLENDNQEIRAENERLARQLNTIQADLTAQQSNYATIKSSIDTATEQYTDATQTAIKAGSERDDAVRKMEVAERDLRDANDRIAALESTVGDRDGSIASLEQTVREKDVLLDIVRTRAPGILELAQPKLVGAVERVDAAGKLVTVLITDDPADAGCKAGYSFAIYSGSTYKGEAVVTSVDGKFAFCRVTRSTGRDILPGDQATTVTN